MKRDPWGATENPWETTGNPRVVTQNPRGKTRNPWVARQNPWVARQNPWGETLDPRGAQLEAFLAEQLLELVLGQPLQLGQVLVHVLASSGQERLAHRFGQLGDRGLLEQRLQGEATPRDS